MACSGRAQTTACLKNGAKLSQFFSPRFAILQQQANVRKCSLNCQIGQGGEMTIFGGGRESICSQMDKILNGSTTTTFTEASPLYVVIHVQEFFVKSFSRNISRN